MRRFSRSHQRRVQQVRPHQPRSTTISSSAWVEGRMADLRQQLHVAQWQVGLHGARRFRQLFPLDYEGIADWPMLPGTVVRVCETFLGLAAQEVEMEYRAELPYPALADPLTWLYEPLEFPDDTVHLHRLMEIDVDLEVPRPVCYGVGLQMFFDEGLHEPRLGTLAIWRMLQRTGWSIGVDLADWIDNWIGMNDDATRENAGRLMWLDPIPPNTPVERMVDVFHLPGWKDKTVQPGKLIRYAVERTDNPIANCANDTPLMLNRYEWPFDWDDLPSFADWQAEAIHLKSAHDAWCDRVAADPVRELRRLERAMHTAAKAVGGRVRVRPKTLMELFTETETPEEVAV